MESVLKKRLRTNQTDGLVFCCLVLCYDGSQSWLRERSMIDSINRFDKSRQHEKMTSVTHQQGHVP